MVLRKQYMEITNIYAINIKSTYTTTCFFWSKKVDGSTNLNEKNISDELNAVKMHFPT